jgi:hypothetical protein
MSRVLEETYIVSFFSCTAFQEMEISIATCVLNIISTNLLSLWVAGLATQHGKE